MTLFEAQERFLEHLTIRKYQRNTIRNYRFRMQILLTFLSSDRDIAYVLPMHLEKFLVSEYMQKLSRGTYNHYIAMMRNFFTYWHDVGEISTNPSRVLEFVKEEQKIIEYFTIEEVRKLLVTNHKYHWGPAREFTMRDRICVHLGALCGLRSSEARLLRWQEVNLEYGEIHVICGKNLKDRIVPMPKPTWDLLKAEFRRRKPAKNDFVLYGFKGKPMNHEIINSVIQRLCKDAGIEKKWPHFHMLRHTCATLYLRGRPKKRGMDIRVLKELLGHADISTTQKYAHVDKGFLADEMKRCLPRI